ncbi:MAG: hypothetical protein ACE144_10905 [Thermodesulfobacteriota bacterium]
MNANRFLFSFILLLAMTLFIAHEGLANTKPGTKAPVITHAYAIDKGRGSIIKIYIEAEDPDGDMSRIATVVGQVGFGSHRTDWTVVKPQSGSRLLGYLQWNTLGSRGRIDEWTRVGIRVSVFDKAGNESNEVVLPFTFVSETVPKPKRPAPFDKEDIPRLGHIDVQLRGSSSQN